MVMISNYSHCLLFSCLYVSLTHVFVSLQVDIFSLGMVIYELTTLRCPFDDMSTLQVNQAIESGIRPSLCQKVNIVIYNSLIV